MTVKVGDKIRVTKPILSRNRYGIGDEFTVAKVWNNGYGIDTDNGTELYNREFEVVSDALVIPEVPIYKPSDLNGKLLRIYTGTDVEGDIKTEVTVGIDEATGVMYVLGMKTEVVEWT